MCLMFARVVSQERKKAAPLLLLLLLLFAFDPRLCVVVREMAVPISATKLVRRTKPRRESRAVRRAC